tara:strand:- start:21435 stop:21782 length:348 start_codon:yes stop_codon:yes gene_type:complete
MYTKEIIAIERMLEKHNEECKKMHDEIVRLRKQIEAGNKLVAIEREKLLDLKANTVHSRLGKLAMLPLGDLFALERRAYEQRARYSDADDEQGRQQYDHWCRVYNEIGEAIRHCK